MIKHTLEQSRAAANLGQAYTAWIDAERATQQSRVRWKTVAGRDYLYRLPRGRDTGTSLGLRSVETEAVFDEAQRSEAAARNGEKRLLVLGRIYKATRLPMIAPFAGEVLRVLDRRGLLGRALLVVGSVAMPAYELEAGLAVDPALQATEDFDLSWAGAAMNPPPRLLDILREADPSWTVSMERSFQALNRDLELIDVLVAPSRQGDYPAARASAWQAVVLDGQEDLLGGRYVEQVVTDLRGRPARIVAPDPRRFALHKWLLGNSPERSAGKRHKDTAQAEQVMDCIEQGMPHYPMDDAFVATLSTRLRDAWDAWRPLRVAAVAAGMTPRPGRR